MRIALVLFAWGMAAAPVAAQTPAAPRIPLVVAPGDTGKAITAALEFLQRISNDSVVLAGCEGGGASQRVPVGGMPIQLPAVVPGSRTFCQPGSVRGSEGVLAIVESVRRIDRDVILPYWDRINFEVELQVQFGQSTREWHTLLVRPAGGIPAESGLEARGWKVSAWRITKWMTH